ncbi:MAG: hypothetical protein RLZZ400_179 [Actinomycetota bacterium]|jgi:5-formyltetrahydrofolate cyclo-ligase
MTPNSANSKADIRKQILTARQSKTPGHACDDAHDENLVLWLADNGYRKIACYVAKEDEPCTDLLLDVCAEVGIEVLVPRVRGESLEWCRFDWDALEPGDFGILEPTTPSESLQVEAVIIPAVAVAEDGTRLGRGKGYYDRALASLPSSIPVVALVHDAELLAEIPSESHDQKVSWVSTCSNLLEVD